MDTDKQPVNILAVDDNPKNLLALEAILQAPDRRMVRAASGDEALRYLLNNEAAVILLDVYMPGMDGLETAALIRGRERSRDIPIIFVTADSAGASHLLKGYSLGAVDFILKPVDPEILRSKVAVFVELYKKTQQIKRQAALLHEKNIEIENANLARLGSLVELGQELSAERDPVRLLEKFCAASCRIVGARHSAVGVLTESGNRLRHFITCDSDGNSKVERRETGKLDVQHVVHDDNIAVQSILDRMLADRRPVRLPEASDTSRPAAPRDKLPDPLTSFLGAPIATPSHVYGWMYFADKRDQETFSEADERLAVTLAAQVAVTYENATLYTEARALTDELKEEIAERRLAEEERARLLVREQAARAEAETANRTKDEFLAVLSHELRTPLTAILGWTHLLRGGGLGEAATERALETVQRNAKSQAQLIDDLLDVSRIITGKMSLNARAVELAAIVETAIESLRPLADANAIIVDAEIDHAASSITGDPHRLQQVIWNLLTNAVKFTPTDGRVTVRLIHDAPHHARLMISDTGQGIKPDFLPHIFDRFRQADGSSTRHHGGLGLGLAIVRHLVELHGGHIRAESAGEGQGSTFSVRFPLRTMTNTPIDRHAADSDVHVGSNTEQILDGLQVLVVDDEPDTRDLVSMVLRQSGADVRASATVVDALEVLAAWRPDCIVSDIGMPGEDGFAFIRKMHATMNGAAIPAVALTAYASVEDRARTALAGFQHHLAKPIEPLELVTVIAGLTGRMDAPPSSATDAATASVVESSV